MNSQPKTRQQKIEVLKKLAAGRMSLRDLDPPRVIVWVSDPDDPAIACDLYGGLKMSITEMEQFIADHPEHTHLVWCGCDD